MVDLTPELQAERDALRLRRPILSPELQAERDALRNSNIGMGEAAGRTLASGLTEGTAGLLALPRTAADFTPMVTNYIGEKLGVPENVRNAATSIQRNLPGMQLAASLPSYQDMTGGMEKLTGGYTNYTPTSLFGKTAKNVISFVPADRKSVV